MLRLGPTRVIARRASAVRAAIALAVALFGFVQVIAVENGAAGTIVGAGLVALAAPLARGRRRALLAAAGLVLASLALDDDVIARPGLAALGLLTALLVCAPAFRASGDPATRRLIVPAAALLAIGLAADLARAGGHLTHPLAATLLVSACLLAARALRPWRSAGDGRSSGACTRRAHRRRTRHRHTRAVHAARRQAVLLRAVGTSFVAYRVVAGVALVSGDPVGDEAAFPALVAAFARFAERRGWTLGVLGASTQRLPLWRDVGLRAHYTGDEAVVDPAAFSLEGRAIRKVRQSVTRLEREGYSAEAVRGSAIDESLAARIAEISSRWRGDRAETGYTMAFAGAAVDREARRPLRHRPRRGRRASRLPALRRRSGGNALSLSTMRRERDTPNGLNEFLICRAIDHAREQRIRARVAQFRGVRPVARPAGAARSALPRGAASAHAFRAALPARAPALVQPEVRAGVDTALRGLSQRGDASPHRTRRDARRGLRHAALGALAAQMTSATRRRPRPGARLCARPRCGLPDPAGRRRSHPRAVATPAARVTGSALLQRPLACGVLPRRERLGPLLRGAHARAPVARADGRRRRHRPARRARGDRPPGAACAARARRRAARNRGPDGARRERREYGPLSAGRPRRWGWPGSPRRASSSSSLPCAGARPRSEASRPASATASATSRARRC